MNEIEPPAERTINLLRFDPHVQRTLDVARAGTIGKPRTLSLEWSFGSDWSLDDATTGLVDVACLLLESEATAVYALSTESNGPPIVKLNLLVANGGIASLEAAWERAGQPTQRHLHLIGTDGEILHRFGQDNLTWGASGSTPIPAPTSPADLSDRATTTDSDSDWDALANAITHSLATGELVLIAETGGRS